MSVRARHPITIFVHASTIIPDVEHGKHCPTSQHVSEAFMNSILNGQMKSHDTVNDHNKNIEEPLVFYGCLIVVLWLFACCCHCCPQALLIFMFDFETAKDGYCSAQ